MCQCAQLAEEAGYDEVFSPADHDRKLLGMTKDWMPLPAHQKGQWKEWNMPDAPTLREMYGGDLKWIVEDATHMAMLPGWENSKGARAEWALAVALGLKIFYH